MSCYILPEGGSIFPSGDELTENQKTEQEIYWRQWNSRISDDLNTTSVYSDEQEKDAAQSFDTDEHQRSNQWESSSAYARAASSDCSTRPSEEQSEGPAPLELQHSKETNDIFLYVQNSRLCFTKGSYRKQLCDSIRDRCKSYVNQSVQKLFQESI